MQMPAGRCRPAILKSKNMNQTEQQQNNEKTYFFEVNNSRAYFHYDEAAQVLTHDGKSVTIFKEMLEDFISTANVLGFKAGEL